jgi:ABC-type uncharacterized transport system substrate-binding protein
VGFTFRRLILGFVLILACSATLLLLDLNHRAGAATDLHRKWKVTMIQFNQVLDVEECEKGVRQGLKNAKLQEGYDYDMTVMNAQGDMPTVSSLIDAAVSNGSDLLITMSTPTLQAAIKRAGSTRVVFTYVADAIAAGAAKSDTDHLPNITGIYYRPTFDEMLAVMKRCIPNLHTVGSLYVPAETNMVFYKNKLEQAAKKAGIEVVILPVNTSSDVADAALALCTQNIDAICQIPGNLLASAFPSVAAAANKAKLPVFAFQTSQVQNGAVMALARDYFDAGEETGQIAARVIRGANPATIPLVGFEKTRIMLNFNAAEPLHIRFPEDLLKQSWHSIGEPPS